MSILVSVQRVGHDVQKTTSFCFGVVVFCFNRKVATETEVALLRKTRHRRESISNCHKYGVM